MRFGRAIVAAVGLACGLPARSSPALTSESAAAAQLERIRGDTVRLLEFLRAMPKGGDLHQHLSGAVRPENWARWASADGLCYVVATSAIVRPPCDAAGRVPASQLVADSTMLVRAVDAWSVRGRQPGESAADHFFATFDKTAAVGNAHLGEMLAEVTSGAAAEHVSYLEVMVNTDEGVAPRMGLRAGWTGDFATQVSTLTAAGLRDSLMSVSATLDRAERRWRELLRCGTPRQDAGCGVTVRYIYQVIRSRRPEQVFAQVVAGFELPSVDRRYVSFNLVAAEHGDVALRDFTLHMRMIDFLRPAYPRVPITLHAGELSTRVAPASAMRSHIRESVQLGHARRIGHGVDVLQEDDAEALLREMAARRVLVEVGLTSNDIILGVHGAEHPLSAYLAHGVPVALGTDDPGISLSDMTHEYLRAVVDQRVGYRTLKGFATNSIIYSFADDSTKMRLRSELERAFERFESNR